MLNSQLSSPVSLQWNHVRQICEHDPRLALLSPSEVLPTMNWLAMQSPENP